ncbi:Outer membrane protein OmpH-likeprecursor [Methyloversatilis universalis FAM5]|jgi:outer membrane protein|uniref:Outer membrane protein OmpH-likeprecursor n=1 Tax=Methyloversatilis universalis (strain ATCC BAA-1314 / DSM 25237 / JCM 13912 / CCUG 52030 / FAM5) TaxID=1000565 RepID=F5RAD0_METUF|nr:OmpH family outer membrane protein [Methyloversatilis universalis]EGK72526.1 Outer membrane protein OmpH-likeprecursor [Methyloversatilis universalis FAM5]
MSVRSALLAALSSLALLAAAPAHAENDVKIGFVDTERILREAAPAVRAQKKLEKEFEKRSQELERMAKQLQSMQQNMEKNAVTLSDSDRRAKEREFSELTRDMQRKEREYREDLNQRRNEELSGVLDKANKAIKVIAEAEKYDIIFQEVVYRSARIDITEKVLKALADPPATK